MRGEGYARVEIKVEVKATSWAKVAQRADDMDETAALL